MCGARPMYATMFAFMLMKEQVTEVNSEISNYFRNDSGALWDRESRL